MNDKIVNDEIICESKLDSQGRVSYLVFVPLKYTEEAKGFAKSFGGYAKSVDNVRKMHSFRFNDFNRAYRFARHLREYFGLETDYAHRVEGKNATVGFPIQNT